MNVITYACAYMPGEVSLCARHAAKPEIPLGPVQHGQHEGACDACEAPIPCANCGSPACEWPGRCDPGASKPAGQLPIEEINGTRYFKDDRLEEFRHVDNPHVRISFEDFDGFDCATCGATLDGTDCPVCTAPLEAPEEILDILNDLIEWDAAVMQSDAEVWGRARAIRDRLVVK